MWVKITANGDAGGTRIIAEGGQDITEYVADVAFRHRLTEPAKFQISLVMQHASVEGNVTTLLGPTGKRVARIEYHDGTVDAYGP